MNLHSILIAKHCSEATPHRRLDIVLQAGNHVTTLILCLAGSVFVGLILAALTGGEW